MAEWFDGTMRSLLNAARQLENLACVSKIQCLESLGGFIGHYVPYWRRIMMVSTEQLSYTSFYYFVFCKKLHDVLIVANALLRDKKADISCGEVCDIIEDAERYLQMFNSISATSDFIEALKQKVKHDFALLWILHRSTCVCSTALKNLPKEIDGNDVKKIGVDDLGRGSFSFVYKAKLRGKEVAVKEIFQSGNCEWSDPSVKTELELHAKLQSHGSPHVPRLLGYFDNKSNNNKSFILELMETDLQKFIKNSWDSISMLQKIDIMIKISKGMSYLHANKVIYRDLKPSNILVSPTPHMSVKIADFGISKYNLRDADAHTLNKGSLNYMAPEMVSICEDEGAYTESVDVYSFAMTCTELLTGKMPFLSPIRGRKALKERLNKMERPVLPKGIPKALKDLMQQCWSEDPPSRPTFECITRDLWRLKERLLTFWVREEQLHAKIRETFWAREKELEGELRVLREFPQLLKLRELPLLRVLRELRELLELLELRELPVLPVLGELRELPELRELRELGELVLPVLRVLRELSELRELVLPELREIVLVLVLVLGELVLPELRELRELRELVLPELRELRELVELQFGELQRKQRNTVSVRV